MTARVELLIYQRVLWNTDDILQKWWLVDDCSTYMYHHVPTVAGYTILFHLFLLNGDDHFVDYSRLFSSHGQLIGSARPWWWSSSQGNMARTGCLDGRMTFFGTRKWWKSLTSRHLAWLFGSSNSPGFFGFRLQGTVVILLFHLRLGAWRRKRRIGGDRQMQNGVKKSRSVVGNLGETWRNCSFSNQAWDFLSIFLRLAHSLLVSRDEQVHKNSFGISYSTDFNFSTTKHQYQYHLLTVFPQNPPQKNNRWTGGECSSGSRLLLALLLWNRPQEDPIMHLCVSRWKNHGTHVTCGMSCR